MRLTLTSQAADSENSGLANGEMNVVGPERAIRVDALHGVVRTWRADRFSHKNYVSRRALAAYLRRQRSPYAERFPPPSTDSSLLTVDDSTRAAALACLIARQRGHGVQFFVNPYQISTGEPYFFTMMDAYIDHRAVSCVSFAGSRYSLATPDDRRRLRATLKRCLRNLQPSDSLTEIHAIGRGIAGRLLAVPDHSAPVTLADLHALQDAGVSVQSHGWSHRSIDAMTTPEFEEHVLRARDWLRQELGAAPELYAVPFGDVDVPEQWRSLVVETTFLLDGSLPAGFRRPRCINRTDIAGMVRSR